MRRIDKVGLAESGLLLAAAGLGIYDAVRLILHKSVVEDVTGPGRYLFLICVLLGLAGLCYLWTQLRQPADAEAASESAPGSNSKVAAIIGGLAVYTLMIQHVGYVVSTAVFIIFILRLLGQRSWLSTIAVALLMSAGLYILFIKISGMVFPRGTLLF